MVPTIWVGFAVSICTAMPVQAVCGRSPASALSKRCLDKRFNRNPYANTNKHRPCVPLSRPSGNLFFTNSRAISCPSRTAEAPRYETM